MTMTELELEEARYEIWVMSGGREMAQVEQSAADNYPLDYWRAQGESTARRGWSSAWSPQCLHLYPTV
jgi:hypothetical protein